MKQRLLYFLLLISIIAFGISTRKLAFYPSFVAEHFGDALWASMVYFGLRFLFPGKRILLAGVVSLAFSFLIEVSQLYHAPWIDQIRGTTIGALILGHGFLWVDLIRYTAGVIVSMVVDWFLVTRILNGQTINKNGLSKKSRR